ncbi:MAG: GAF domain-containing protein [Pseudomonadota bacterium]
MTSTQATAGSATAGLLPVTSDRQNLIEHQTRDVIAMMLDLVRDQLKVPQAMVTLGRERPASVVITAGDVPAEAIEPVLSRICLDAGGRLVVDDTATLDAPLCDEMSSERIGAYLGLALVDAVGRPVGVVCAADTRPRAWSKRDVDTLRGLATVIDTELRTVGIRAEAA